MSPEVARNRRADRLPSCPVLEVFLPRPPATGAAVFDLSDTLRTPITALRKGQFADRKLWNFWFLHSALMPAALMIGHHFSISAFCNLPSASGVCRSRGTTF
jgi:hypothetical protein